MNTNMKNYKLPMNIAAALSAGRPELIGLMPVDLDPETQKEVLRLLCDLIAERRAQDDKLMQLKHVIEQTRENIIGSVSKLDRTVVAFENEATREDMMEATRRKEPSP